MYANGEGVPPDDAEAVRWYRLAADQEHPTAQFTLGNLYARGQGVPRDETEAARWSRLAAEHGVASAQYSLGLMYATGQGVQRDDVEAHMWFNLAAAQSSGEDRETYVTSRDTVAARMTADQIAEAQRRAREWTPTLRAR